MSQSLQVFDECTTWQSNALMARDSLDLGAKNNFLYIQL